MERTTNRPPRVWRSRWAAVGAAVAVTLGAGGMVAVNAAPSAPSAFVSIDPLVRILDTRTNAGLTGPFASGVARTLQVTGNVPTQPPNNAPKVDAVVVPAGATSVVLNVTVIGPQTNGFVAIRPGTATGFPGTSNQNFSAGGQNIANSVTVQLPANGKINIFVQGTVRAVALDVAGFYSSGATGPKGDPGPTGPTGPPAPPGSNEPPKLFFAEGGQGTPTNVFGSSSVQLLTLQVPAGSYHVAAKLNVDSTSGGTLTCQLDTVDLVGILILDKSVKLAFGNEPDTLGMLTELTSDGGAIKLNCTTPDDFDLSWFSMEAIEVLKQP
jgi:hypothetical protein